MVTSVS